MLYWVEPTDPLTALDARYPQYDLEPYVSKAIRVASSYLLELHDSAYSIDQLDVEDVDNLLTAAWFLIQKLQEAGACMTQVTWIRSKTLRMRPIQRLGI